ncbi:MAG: DUF5752 family protein [Candidatus Woesearchaeota archaeon]
MVKKKSADKKVTAKKVVKTAPVKAGATTLPVKVPVAMLPVVKKHTLYVEVTPEKYFVLCDGRKIKSGKELADILQLINDDMFKYHVTESKNDFSNWINDVFGEQDLAKKMRTIRNRLEMSIELYRAMFDKLEKLDRK